jgi:hypothetical protein
MLTRQVLLGFWMEAGQQKDQLGAFSPNKKGVKIELVVNQASVRKPP